MVLTPPPTAVLTNKCINKGYNNNKNITYSRGFRKECQTCLDAKNRDSSAVTSSRVKTPVFKARENTKESLEHLHKHRNVLGPVLSSASTWFYLWH